MSKTYVLTKSALLSSPDVLQRIGNGENKVVVPKAVLDELYILRGTMEPTTRFMADTLFEFLDSMDIQKLTSEEGHKLEDGSTIMVAGNHVQREIKIEGITSSQKRILQVADGLKAKGENVIIISNNPIFRMNAKIMNLKAEEIKDKFFPKFEFQYQGCVNISDLAMDFTEFKKEEGYISVSDICGYEEIEWTHNMYVVMRNIKGQQVLGIHKHGKIYSIYPNLKAWEMEPKNMKQAAYMDALLDPVSKTPIVITKGLAGTGKTLLALAAALQGVENGEYKQIIICRSVAGKVGQKDEEVGYYKGDKNEKMLNYVKGIRDNLEVLLENKEFRSTDGIHKDMTNGFFELEDFIEANIIDIQPIVDIRGRSFRKCFYIIDEVQNLHPAFMKSILSRTGEGTKVVILGDPTQIDRETLTQRYNGLVYSSELLKGNDKCKQITFPEKKDIVRSETAGIIAALFM